VGRFPDQYDFRVARERDQIVVIARIVAERSS